MANSGDLLRMLEPAVRPVAAPGAPPSKSTRAPFETRSFDTLLQEAQTKDTAASDGVTADKVKPADPLSTLSRIDAIQNASLRQIINTHRD